MAYSRTVMGVGFILMATASLASAATLRVDDATAPVGGWARVAVNLDNPEDDVRALQFSLGALPAGVQFVGAEASGRAAGLTADAEPQPDGTVKVVLISLGAETVAAGTGPVLDLHFALHGTGSTSVALMPTEVRVAGTAGALDTTGQGGQLDVEGESAAPASVGGCAIGPTSSRQPLWLSLMFAAVLLIGRSRRRAAVYRPRLWPTPRDARQTVGVLSRLAGTLLVLCSVSSARAATFNESFDGPTISPSLTVSSSAGFTYSLIGGEAVLEKASGTGNGQIQIGTNFAIVGDFTATVIATRVDLTGDGEAGIGTWHSSVDVPFHDIFFFNNTQIISNMTGFGSQVATSSASQVTFRIRRVGQALFEEFDAGGGFQTLHSGSDPNFAVPLPLNLFLTQEYGHTNGHSVRFDDFSIIADAFAPRVILRVGDATAAPGQQRVAIPILLSNDVAVRALQFALIDAPDQVTLSASPVCSLTSRSSGLSCDCYQSGGVIRCVLLSTGAATIAAGSGQVATVFVDDTAPACTGGQTIQLNLSDTAVADANNNPVSHTTVNGSLRCGCAEDLNCDTHTDIFDALICVDLILGRNPARCADADLDGSGRTDIFDCLLIVDTILGRRTGCP